MHVCIVCMCVCCVHVCVRVRVCCVHVLCVFVYVRVCCVHVYLCVCACVLCACVLCVFVCMCVYGLACTHNTSSTTTLLYLFEQTFVVVNEKLECRIHDLHGVLLQGCVVRDMQGGVVRDMRARNRAWDQLTIPSSMSSIMSVKGDWNSLDSSAKNGNERTQGFKVFIKKTRTARVVRQGSQQKQLAYAKRIPRINSRSLSASLSRSAQIAHILLNFLSRSSSPS